MRAMRAMQGRRWRGARAPARLLGSVRVRLTLWYLLILAVVFLVFGGVVYTATRNEAESAARAHLAAAAQGLLAAYDASDGRLHVTDPWAGGQVVPAKALLGSGYPLDLLDIAVLVDARGNVAQALGPVTPAAVADLRDWQKIVAAKAAFIGQTPTSLDVLQLSVRGDKQVQRHGAAVPDVAVAAPYAVTMVEVRGGGQHVGWLVVASLSRVADTLGALVPGLLVAGPATLLIAALGGYWLAARAMRPVRLITRAAREIGETDLSRRLHVKRRDELGELAATFDGMLARLEAAFARQRQLTADASHELRTPLAIVGLEAERALARRREPEEYERALVVIQAENAHMGRLVDDLLTLARADAGVPPARTEPLDLSDLALETVERLAPLARERGVELVTEDLPEVTVRGDRGSLARMLANLVENGIKYTAGQGTRVAISTGIAERVDGAWAWARIEDDGPGIPTEHLPHLFDRFYRADVMRGGDDRSDGSGLGLAIARWAAETHGGQIHAENGPNGGARFEVWLPLPARPRARES